MSLIIFPPELGEVEAKFALDPRFIYKNLERMFSPGPTASIFNVKSSEIFPVSVQSLDPKTGMKLKVEESPRNGLNAFMGQTCYFIAGLEGGKLQFPVVGLKSAESGFLSCDIPKTMSLIQRREDLGLAPLPTELLRH